MEYYRRLSQAGPATALEKGVFLALCGCGLVYGTLGWLRERGYRWGLWPSYRPSVPTISVGNIVAGGTGKTPVVDHIARIFTACGKKTAVVSRGYGREGIKTDRVVSCGDGPLIPPELAGDEPFLLARRNPRLLVLVARRRRRAVEKAVREFGAEVVILDDGFQHFAVRRHLDIVLLDGLRPLGNGRVLPAGPLREFPSALKRGDLFFFTRSDGLNVPCPVPGRVFHCRHVLQREVQSLDGRHLPLADLIPLKGGAFAGLADSERFFRNLLGTGLRLERSLSFPDHVRYGSCEIDALRKLAEGIDYLVTTEKDAVKLRPSDFSLPCYQVPLGVEFLENMELEKLLAQLVTQEDGTCPLPRNCWIF
ncbi:MAG: tetraacyldisaccharide 4'-kinase [Deltaproteobacteria bacterium]|nr:tetraacyldisaccharide 4'-kinase [Deltaproteobacteria bacterium]